MRRLYFAVSLLGFVDGPIVAVHNWGILYYILVGSRFGPPRQYQVGLVQLRAGRVRRLREPRLPAPEAVYYARTRALSTFVPNPPATPTSPRYRTPVRRGLSATIPSPLLPV